MRSRGRDARRGRRSTGRRLQRRFPGRGRDLDLDDFTDDYRVEPELRNDWGLFWLVEADGGQPVRLEAVPIALELAHTRLDSRAFHAAVDTAVRTEHARLVIDLT